ncbi:Major facilitator superfamily MFS_1 [Verrucomicrobia bacterium]|nr:Major facilitator superfamily MFS_1 [Verrucomicrobiota bacterium]
MNPAAASPPLAHPAAGRGAARNPWLWVPSLYFSQGIPYVIVMTMSVVMYKRLGISNTDIALYTSWLYLPWVIKPLWSPFVDIIRTKRFWIVAMQCLVSVGLALAALAVRGAGFFGRSLALFWIMAFASATHDIAADGFYMLSMTPHEQAWWVGLRSTFYRTAMIVGSGLLVVLAGVLEQKNGLPPLEIPVQTAPTSERNSLTDGPSLHVPAPPDSVPAWERKPSPNGALHLASWPPALAIAPTERSPDEVQALIDQAKKWNQGHGFYQESTTIHRPSSLTRPSSPLQAKVSAAGNVGIFLLALSHSPEPGQKVVVTVDRHKRGLEYLGLARGDKGFRLMEGERLVFNSTNWDQPARVVIQLDPKLKGQVAVVFLASSGNIPLAWSITLFAVAGLFLAFCGWHSLMLPRPVNDGPVVTDRGLAHEFFLTLGSFFEKPGVLLAILFILLFRFDEAQLVKVISPFLLDNREAGGLGLTTSQVGLAYGTFGILALTCGGLLGGFMAARQGLKRMLPFMLGSIYLPKLAFIFLSFFQPENFLITCGAVAMEQFGYGFGFTAFMLYMLYFADGPHKTAHYAICTGFMALGMMIPGMWSGWLADRLGYKHFFIWVICSTLPGFTIALLLKIDPAFGKKQAVG